MAEGRAEPRGDNRIRLDAQGDLLTTLLLPGLVLPLATLFEV